MFFYARKFFNELSKNFVEPQKYFMNPIEATQLALIVTAVNF